ALAGLFLDGGACNGAGGGVLRTGAGDEDEARRFDRLAVGGRWRGGIWGGDDLAGHVAPCVLQGYRGLSQQRPKNQRNPYQSPERYSIGYGAEQRIAAATASAPPAIRRKRGS